MTTRKRRKFTSNKRNAQTAHAVRRAWERYPGVKFNRANRLEVLRQITERESTFVEKQSNRVKVHIVTSLEEIEMLVCYDSIRKCLITALPPQELRLVKEEMNKDVNRWRYICVQSRSGQYTIRRFYPDKQKVGETAFLGAPIATGKDMDALLWELRDMAEAALDPMDIKELMDDEKR